MTAAAVSIQQLAHGLYDMASAPRAQWRGFVHRIEELKFGAGATALPCAFLLAGSAKAIARQMPYANENNETELRGVALALSTVLLNELAAAGFEIEAPWWNKA